MTTAVIRAKAPQRPTLHAEQALLSAIIEGDLRAGTALPGERDLASRLGVTRPTLREALQRLERDGWITIQQGKLTRVNDYWVEGGLNVLSSLVHHARRLPPEFVPNLLEVRLAIAPAYARAAVERSAPEVISCLASSRSVPDAPADFAAFDWKVHHTLTVLSGNPVYTLILNGFADFYDQMAKRYFVPAGNRASSRSFYARLLSSATQRDGGKAERITRAVMKESIARWRKAAQAQSGAAKQNPNGGR